MTICVTQRGPVLELELRAPTRRNAFSRAMLDELGPAVQGCSASAVVVSGGAVAFSAGADLAEITGRSRDMEYDEHVAAAVTALIAPPVPVISAIEGPRIGAAVELALACDVLIESALFEIPAVRLRLLYPPAAVERMSRILPQQTLARLLVFHERLDAGPPNRLVWSQRSSKLAPQRQPRMRSQSAPPRRSLRAWPPPGKCSRRWRQVDSSRLSGSLSACGWHRLPSAPQRCAPHTSATASARSISTTLLDELRRCGAMLVLAHSNAHAEPRAASSREPVAILDAPVRPQIQAASRDPGGTPRHRECGRV